jgi:hypothetical protein
VKKKRIGLCEKMQRVNKLESKLENLNMRESVRYFSI